MNTYNFNGFNRINKKQARNAFNAGLTVYVQASNLAIDSRLMTPYVVNHHNIDDTETFDTMVNAFEYYNCDNERGRYATFYTK